MSWFLHGKEVAGNCLFLELVYGTRGVMPCSHFVFLGFSGDDRLLCDTVPPNELVGGSEKSLWVW